MRVISQREFRNNSANVMHAVEAGESYLITRNGVEVAELRPVVRRRRLALVDRDHLPQAAPERLDRGRAWDRADDFFGPDDDKDRGPGR